MIQKILYVFAGSDETGKEYLVNTYKKNDKDAKSTSLFPSKELKCINPIQPNKSPWDNWDDLNAANKKWLLDAIISRDRFAIQTVLNTEQEVKFIKIAKRLEYKIHAFYVITSENDNSILSMYNVVSESDFAYIYDSSCGQGEIVFEKKVISETKSNESMEIVKATTHICYKKPTWLDMHLIARIHDDNENRSKKDKIKILDYSNSQNSVNNDKPVSEPKTEQESSMPHHVYHFHKVDTVVTGNHNMIFKHLPIPEQLPQFVKMLKDLASELEEKVEDMAILLNDLKEVQFASESDPQKALKILSISGSIASLITLAKENIECIPEAFRSVISWVSGILE